ncbi:MAG: hypothetical protein WC307_06345 [Candidatus Nanoarchaeia archaeon]|jgi:hypothetical protein
MFSVKKLNDDLFEVDYSVVRDNGTTFKQVDTENLSDLKQALDSRLSNLERLEKNVRDINTVMELVVPARSLQDLQNKVINFLQKNSGLKNAAELKDNLVSIEKQVLELKEEIKVIKDVFPAEVEQEEVSEIVNSEDLINNEEVKSE